MWLKSHNPSNIIPTGAVDTTRWHRHQTETHIGLIKGKDHE